jgi:hypothetical protein
MGRTKHPRRKGPPKPPPRRPRPGGALHIRPVVTDNACVVCGAVQANKFDSTLMCSFGHATCFACVAAGVQPHALCGHACNGFKYKCGGCNIWLCINRTQELALMCGGHGIARERLREEAIAPQTFESAEAYYYYDPAVSEGEEEEYSEDTRSTSSSEYCGECACAGARKDVGTQLPLPRVCAVDWTAGQEQRARRLARLRASLLGHVP